MPKTLQIQKAGRPARLELCTRCPRIVKELRRLRRAHPEWHNAPVGMNGPHDAPLLIVGLAPGRLGANRTGKAFEGDRSSETLWAAIAAAGLGRSDVAITNALKCFPPDNKPTTTELSTCATRFLSRELDGPKVWLALGRLAHEAILRTCGLALAAHPFGHGAVHHLPWAVLVDCYHPSPRNIATGRLRPGMLATVVRTAHGLTS